MKGATEQRCSSWPRSPVPGVRGTPVLEMRPVARRVHIVQKAKTKCLETLYTCGSMV